MRMGVTFKLRLSCRECGGLRSDHSTVYCDPCGRSSQRERIDIPTMVTIKLDAELILRGDYEAVKSQAEKYGFSLDPEKAKIDQEDWRKRQDVKANQSIRNGSSKNKRKRKVTEQDAASA